MSKLKPIPIIDLFAGPGGLGEGFSSIYKNNARAFDIKLSIEKDENAHSTLELRSFFRQFAKDKVPDEYYKVLKESDPYERKILKESLYNRYPREYGVAQKEAWRAELGSEEYPSEEIDTRIKKGIGSIKDWLLIGGPPCQAYSLVGRSRVGGIDSEDHRVYLYKEYLRIIAVHHPAVFVMENVKGLLSAKVNGEKVFNWILRDLKDPASVFDDIEYSPKYKIYSLSNQVRGFELDGSPSYEKHTDFLIKSEDYNIPQKRHRVILVGIREDIDVNPEILHKEKTAIDLESVIGDLPKIRSGVGRSIVSSSDINGKKKRIYKQEENSNSNWENIINKFRSEIIAWNGFAIKYDNEIVNAPSIGVGSEYVKCETPSEKNPLFEWFYDSNLDGTCNHQSRNHLLSDLKRYMFSSMYSKINGSFPRLHEFNEHGEELMPDHKSAESGKFADRFRVQLPNEPATTVTSHISKDGHYFIHYDPDQCRSLTVREAARIQTFPDNYLFCGSRTAQYHQVGNAVPPYLAHQIAQIVLKIFKKI